MTSIESQLCDIQGKGAKEVKFTTGLPLLQEEKINIELKLIDKV